MKESKKVIVFAGTTEGRILTEWLMKENIPSVVSVATEYGMECLKSETASGIQKENRVRIRWGRLNREEIEALIRREEAGLVVDATHPYAVQITSNIREACEGKGDVVLLRCLREASRGMDEIKCPDACENTEDGKDRSQGSCVYFHSMEEAAGWLEQTKGNILVTTGSKELAAFDGIKDRSSRIYARVLPAEASIQACREHGYEGRHVIGMQGPFSEEMNYIQLKEYDCRFLVTKDGGRVGGFEEKLRGAARAGATAVVIRRPKEDGLPLKEVLRQIKEWMRHE